ANEIARELDLVNEGGDAARILDLDGDVDGLHRPRGEAGSAPRLLAGEPDRSRGRGGGRLISARLHLGVDAARARLGDGAVDGVAGRDAERIERREVGRLRGLRADRVAVIASGRVDLLADRGRVLPREDVIVGEEILDAALEHDAAQRAGGALEVVAGR